MVVVLLTFFRACPREANETSKGDVIYLVTLDVFFILRGFGCSAEWNGNRRCDNSHKTYIIMLLLALRYKILIV